MYTTEKEEMKMSLLTGDTITYIKNPKELIKKFLELSKYSKFAGCKGNICKSFAHLYNSYEQKGF